MADKPHMTLIVASSLFGANDRELDATNSPLVRRVVQAKHTSARRHGHGATPPPLLRAIWLSRAPPFLTGAFRFHYAARAGEPGANNPGKVSVGPWDGMLHGDPERQRRRERWISADRADPRARASRACLILPRNSRHRAGRLRQDCGGARASRDGRPTRHRRRPRDRDDAGPWRSSSGRRKFGA